MLGHGLKDSSLVWIGPKVSFTLVSYVLTFWVFVHFELLVSSVVGTSSLVWAKTNHNIILLAVRVREGLSKSSWLRGDLWHIKSVPKQLNLVGDLSSI